MRGRLSDVLFFVFAMWTGAWAGLLAASFIALWLAGVGGETTLIGFMAANGFAAFSLVIFFTGLIYAAAVAAIVLWARGKSAKDYGLIERRIDDWMTRMSRSDRTT